MTRREMEDEFWRKVTTSIGGYSRAIDRLLKALTDEQLLGLLRETEEEDDWEE